MVLKASDYEVPSPGERMNPMEGIPFISRVAGIIVVFSVLAFAWQFASNRGASLIDQFAGSLTGGLLSSTGQGGDDMWNGV